MHKTKVAVIIPAYNEALVLGDVVRNARKVFRRSSYDAKIIVVNDGSKDDTSAVAKEAGALVIDHILNSGAGSATATGLSYANQKGFAMAATMDADGQHDPKDVVDGFDVMKKTNADLIIGSRLINSEGMSWVKKLGNKGLSALTYLLFGINSTDSQSGLRIYSPTALANLRWRTTGYDFCSEMLWRAKQLRLSVGEYPISAIYTDYSKSKGQNNWNGINIVKSLIKRRVTELFE